MTDVLGPARSLPTKLASRVLDRAVLSTLRQASSFVLLVRKRGGLSPVAGLSCFFADFGDGKIRSSCPHPLQANPLREIDDVALGSQLLSEP